MVDQGDIDSNMRRGALRRDMIASSTANDDVRHEETKEATRANTTTENGHPDHASEFEVFFHEKDRTNPKNWSPWYRAWVLFCIAFSSLVVSLYSTIYTSSIPGMQKEFGIIDNTIPTLGITTYLVGTGLGSLVQAPLSEVFGRRPIYLISMTIFAILIIPCALATSIIEVLVVRLFG